VNDKGPYHAQDEVPDMTARTLPELALARFVPSNEAMKSGTGGIPVLPSVEDAYQYDIFKVVHSSVRPVR
jgi:hypothetical protein